MANDIYFITSNKGKAAVMQRLFEQYDIKRNIFVKNLEIIEPQVDSVAEISKYKALEAYKILQKPVIVEDGGLCIRALKGFPGVYSKYVGDTIGPEGFVRLMQGVEDRRVEFVSVTTYVDADGNITQFERDGGGCELATKVVDVDNPKAWSDMWKILYFAEEGKTLAEFSEEELKEHNNKAAKNGSLQKFAKWYVKNN